MKQGILNRRLNELTGNLTDDIRKECQRLLKAGKIDISRFKDDYRLPKMILKVATENVISQHTYFYWENTDLENIDYLRKL